MDIEAPQNAPVRLLHIDDDPLFTSVVARRLAHHGIEAEPLHDERQWQSRLQTSNYQVVLLDIDMPHHDGLQVLRDIKRFDGSIEVIMLTGLVRMHVVLEALRDGAGFCFFKPVEDIEPIVRAIRSAPTPVDHWREAVRYARAELERLRSAAWSDRLQASERFS